jgi:hypothetical protein
MPCVGFEPTIPAVEREKTVHALDRTVSVIGHTVLNTGHKLFVPLLFKFIIY